MVEGTGLENRHTGNGIVSSNLTLSVNAPRTAGRLTSRWARCRPTGADQASRRLVDRGNLDGWPSGLRRTPGKCVYVKSVPWVRIPPHPLRWRRPHRAPLFFGQAFFLTGYEVEGSTGFRGLSGFGGFGLGRITETAKNNKKP